MFAKLMVNKTPPFSFQSHLSLSKCMKQHFNYIELKDNMLIAHTELLLQTIEELLVILNTEKHFY